MRKQIIHGLVLIQTWGEDEQLIMLLKEDIHVISVFHIMGRHSYLIDVNFDSKEQLESWISKIKSLKLPVGVPSVISIQSNKVIDIYKQKESFGLSDYHAVRENYHMFMMIDNPHQDEKLISLLGSFQIVYSILHIQGEHSFIAELITDSYDSFRELLRKVKALDSVWRIETHEVISVPKYRNQILDESGNLYSPKEDIRQLYSL